MKSNFSFSKKSSFLKKLLPALLALLCASFLHAESRTLQKLEWNDDKNVLEYKIELEDVLTGKKSFVTTSKNYAELSLPTGKYRYKIHAYNLLGKEAEVSDWISFEVFKASVPNIAEPQKEVVMSDSGNTFDMDVSLSGISSETKIELVNVESGERVKGRLIIDDEANQAASETSSAAKAEFPKIKEGSWKLAVTNASGLSSESTAFTVVAQSSATALPSKASEQAARTASENAPDGEITPDGEIAPDSEITPDGDITPEDTIAPDSENEDAVEARLADNENREQEEKRLAEEEKLAEAKRRREERRALLMPHKKPAWTLAGGAALVTVPYGELIDFLDSKVMPSLNARFTYVQPYAVNWKFGVEAGSAFSFAWRTTEFYQLNLLIYTPYVDLVYRHRLFSEMFAWQIKAGGGYVIVTETVDYLKEAGGRNNESKSFAYPFANGAASFLFLPNKKFSLEVGADVMYNFMKGMHTIFVEPYVSAGVRF